MQNLLGVVTLCVVTSAWAEALNAEIIGADGKEQYAVYWRKGSKQRKVYDPILHKMRLLNHAADGGKAKPQRLSGKDHHLKSKKLVGAKKTGTASRRHEEQIAKVIAMQEMAQRFDKVQVEDKLPSPRSMEKLALTVGTDTAEKPKDDSDSKSLDAFQKMDEDGGASEQGFSGPQVEHNDAKTATGDWRSEYGPADSDSKSKICREYPDNAWCHKQLRKTAPVRSLAVRPTLLLASLLAVGVQLGLVIDV